MMQAGRSLQLPFPPSLGGCASDQEEQTGHWSVFSTLNMCCLKETLIVLFNLILTAPLQGWEWVIFILQERNQRRKRFYCLSCSWMKPWHSAFQSPCLSMTPCHREGKPHRNQPQILIEHLQCARY